MPADDSFDFFGVRLQARIQVTQGGVGAALDPNDPTAFLGAVPDFIAFLYSTLEEIRVEEQMGTVSTIEVSFSVPYNIALKVMASPYIQRTNILHLRWGYAKTSNQMRPWMSGIIVSPPRVQIGATTRISFTANGWGHALMRQRRTGSVPKSKNGTARDAFVEILSEFGFDPVGQLKDDLASPEWKKPITPFPRADLSDWGVLRAVANRTGNDFFVSGNQVIVAAKNQAFQSTPKRAVFRIFGQIDPSNFIFPMSNFELLNADALFLPPFQTEVAATYMNADTMEIKQVRAKPSDQVTVGGMKGTDDSLAPASPTPGGQAIQKSAQGQGTPSANPQAQRSATGTDTLHATVHLPQTTDANEAQRVSEVPAKARVQAMYVQVGWDGPGLPWMTPEVVVELAGVGIFDGSYLVQLVEHTIGRGGYDMRCEGVSRTAAQALLTNTPAIGGLFVRPEPPGSET
jgi:hypothetical protein